MSNSFRELMNMVQEFQTVFKLPINEHPNASPGNELTELRHRLMQEENDEYFQACKEEDIIQIADALGDKLYILLGTIITHGLQDQFENVFKEIHRSNMSKLDAEGKPVVRNDGKILKSDLYSPPNISRIIETK